MTAGRAPWRRLALLVLVVVLGMVAGGFYWDARGRVATVDAGRLYRSKAMPPERLVEVSRHLGIRTVIDLRKPGPGVTAEADALARAGIRHVSLPSTQVPELATIDRFLDLMGGEVAQPVLIHCRHGVGRTGVFSAVYRMERQGWSSLGATVDALIMAGGGSFGPFSEKRAFLGRYQLRHRRLASAVAAEPAAAVP